MLIFINGSLVPKEEAKISVFDRGFLYGDGAFETIRIYDGKPFMVDEHITRLLNGLKTLRFHRLPAGLKVYALKSMEANNVKNGVLRIAVTRGELISGIDPSTCDQPTVVIAAREGIPYNEGLYEKGFKAIIPSVRKDSRSPICKVKSSNFLGHILAKGEATEAGVDEAIMLNYEGLVTEATVSNIFLVKGDKLMTPFAGSGILPGITRNEVLGIAEKMGLKAEERGITPEELYCADEAFLTNSLMEIMPLVEVDKRPLGSGLPGKITGEVRKNYKQLVREQLS